MSWSKIKIEWLTHVVTKGTTPTKRQGFADAGVNFIKAEALNGDSALNLFGGFFISDDVHQSLKRSILQEGDVLLTIAGANIGKCGIVEERHLPANTNQAVGIMRVDQKRIAPRFLYYWFKQPQTFRYIQGLNAQAAQPNINLNMLRNIEVPVPSMSEQQRITDILSAYDDLIENNRRRIQLLEQAARLLYKEWFVRLRFPGHEHVKIIDGVPEGWRKRCLSEIADITMGQSPKSIYYNEAGNGLPFHQGVSNFGVRFPTHETYCTVKNRIAEPGDILFSVRAPVGRINITSDKIVIGRGLAAIRSNRGQQNLLFYALKSHFFKEDMMGGGAIFAAITKKDLHSVELVQPTERLATMFMQQVQPVDQQIANLQQTNNNLHAARDLLLPKLMNGEVAV